MSKNNWNVISGKDRRGLFAFILAALISTSAYNAQAVTFLWNNTGSQWTSTTSWTNGVAPTATSSSSTTDEVQFGNFGANFNSVDLTSTRALQNLTFLANGNAYTFGTTSAKYLEISKGVTNNSTATQTFNTLLYNANNNNTWTQVTGGNLVFNNGVSLGTSATARTVTLAGGGTFTFNSAITQATSTGSKLVVNNAGGVVNLNNFANAIGGATGGGTVITAGQVNFSNAQSLGTGIVELGAVAGSVYGSSILNNASGNAIALTGLTGVTWSGVITSGNTGIQFGTSASTSANNIDFGSGLVTASTDRSMNIAGTGVTISMGTLTTSGAAASYEYRIDGAGNTLDLDGWKISGATVPDKAAQHKFKGSANLNIGKIENGTGAGAYANGVSFNSDGVTSLTGNNTYTGITDFVGSGTNIISGNNSSAVGNVKIAGGSGTGKKPVVRLDSVNAISSSSSLLGASSVDQVGTLEIGVASDIVLNSYGTATIDGNNMIFTNSSATQRSLTFTNANNYITLSSTNTGSKKLDNQSANLDIRFNGNIDIGSSSNNNVSFGGAGNFRVDGAVTNGSSTGVRGLTKTGAGTLTLAGEGNNYNGATTVAGGTLEVGAAGALPVASAITVSSGATLRFLNSSAEIAVGAMTVTGTLEQELVTIISSGVVNLEGSTLKVNGTPSLASYTLVKGNSLVGTPTLSPAIPGYSLTNSTGSLNLVGQPVQSGYASYLSDNNLPADTAFDAKFDGVVVGLKYAFGSANGMPQNNGITALPVVGGNQLTTYTFDVKDDSALTVTYQTSTDLVSWSAAQTVSAVTGSLPTDGFVKKQVQATGSGKLFFRIIVAR